LAGSITIPKIFGQGGAKLDEGNRTNVSSNPNLYETFVSLDSDIINIRLAISELISVDGASTIGITLPAKLVSFE